MRKELLNASKDIINKDVEIAEHKLEDVSFDSYMAGLWKSLQTVTLGMFCFIFPAYVVKLDLSYTVSLLSKFDWFAFLEGI